MIKLSIPGLFDNYPTLMQILQEYYENRNLFYDDRIIDSFYGTENSLIWRGGRTLHVIYPYNLDDIYKSLEQFPEIKVRHTFTNCLINEQIINDYSCNNFVKRYIRPQDEVILNHPLLIKHFQDNYPNIPIIYSTTLDIKDIDKVNELTKNHIYVLNYNYNNDKQYLAKLEHPNNIEIICAEPCLYNCSMRAQHYKTISKETLAIPLDKEDIEFCPFIKNPITFYEIMQRPHAITNERLKELEKQGFEYYKISGRGIYPVQLINVLLYYLAQPQYIDHIREKILRRMYYG